MMAMIVVLILSICDEGRSQSSRNEPQRVNISEEPYLFDFDCNKQKREEIMRHYGYRSVSANVEKRSKLDIKEFWDLYDGKWPVIITDIVPRWKAYRKWSKDFFASKYGDVRVVLTSVKGGLQDGVAHVHDLRDFIGILDQPPGPTLWTYMEDELFIVRRPTLLEDVAPNPLLEENYFDLFPDEIKPWNNMFLWGTKYSRSPLHMDPYNWTALSAVIWGHKKWKLFPPGQDYNLYIESKYKCGFPLECHKYNSQVDTFSPDYQEYLKFRDTEYLEVDQYGGELLVVPTGWYHQAYNDEETLSISSQLMNHNNYLAVLEEIIKGGNLRREKLPPLFNTLLPPDQVKLFLSLIPKKILQKGRELTENVLKSLDESASK